MPSIFLTSDLHLDDYSQSDNENFAKKLPSADILILAGDYTNGPKNSGRLANFIQLVESKYKHIIYILGNHDHWHGSFEELNEPHKAILESNSKVKLLRNESLVLSEYPDIMFFGGTLWYNTPRRDWIDERKAKKPEQIDESNKDFKKKLSALNTESKKLVVISHHMPSEKCIHPVFVGAFTNPYFVDNCEYLIEEKKPAYWFHGHTHEVVEVSEGPCMIASNPRGYNGEHSKSFEEKIFQKMWTV